MMRVLFALFVLFTTQIVFAQAENEAFLEALEKYPAAKEMWEQMGKSNGFDVDFVVTEPSCNGFSDGSICSVPVIPGDYSYFWFGNGTTDSCIVAIDAGNYLLQVTNNVTLESCIFNIDVNEPSSIGVFAMNAIPPDCAGECSGEANPLAGGGTGTLTYLYDSGENTQAATMLCNPFILTITDDNNCTVDTTFIFTDAPDTLVISALIMDISCSGDMDGSIDATIVGGTGDLDYSWDFMGGEISDDEDISNLDSGTYTLTVTDENGCMADSAFIVLDAIPIELVADFTDVICFGDATGAISLDVFGGDSTYVYSWTGPNTFTSALEDIEDLEAGTYNLTITDGLNCDKDTFFILEESLPILITAVITEVDCYNALTGAIDVTVTGPFVIDTYVWTGDINSGDEDITGVAAGTYTLTVTDAMGCVVDSTFVLDDPDEIILTADVTDILCAGDETGAIDLTAIGGTGVLTYEWSPDGEITQDLIDLEAGDYTVVVTDENMCIADTLLTVTEPLPIDVDETITHVACNGDATGSITVLVSGGTGLYSLDWDPIIPNNVPAGIYTLTVQDENLCEVEFDYEILQPDSISIDVTVEDVTCFGLSTGSIVATASGGTGVLTLVWSPPIDPTMVQAGDYLLTVTDENMCQKDTLITVNEPDEIILTADITDILCAEDGDGAIDLTATGGTGILTYLWSPDGEMTEDLSGLSGGDYTVVVTDENMCTADSLFTVLEPLPIEVDATITHVDCNGESTGSIVVTPSGGTGVYLLVWDPVIPTDVPAGIYTLTISDENLCEEVFVYEILEAAPILIDAIVTDVTCNGLSDGSIEVTVSGGTGALTIEWTPPIDPTMVPVGVYLLTVTDENMCVKDTLITVDEPDEIFIDIAIIDLDCFGDSVGEIDITPIGGTGAYTYVWTGPAGPYDPNGQDIAGLVAGTYTVVVTDENMCTESVSGDVDQPLAINVEAVVTHIECSGDAVGSIVTTTTNGSGVYTYLWDGPSITPVNETDEDVFDLEAGTYTLTVTDDNLCAIDTLFEVLENDPILVIETITDVLCFEDSTGSVTLDVTGGSGVITYSWTNGMGITGAGQDIFGLPAGTISVTITDELNCEVNLDFDIDESAPILISAVVNDPLCFSEENGNIDVTVTGDFPDFDHAWTGPPGFVPVSGIGLDLVDLGEGTYTVTVTDAVGCMVDSSFTLIDPADLEATLDLTDPGCDLTDGMAEATVSGGTVTVDYTYAWFLADMTPLGSTGPIQGGLGAGAYIFIVTDDNGCSVQIPFELSDEVGTISALITDVTCFDDCDGAIDVDIAGLTGMLDIDWTGPDGPFVTEDLIDVCAGAYTITVEDELGCELVETYTVGTPAEISINATVIHESCPDTDDGAIDITVTGGTGITTYLWNGPGVVDVPTQDITDLVPGTYSVDVTDESNCVHTESFTVDPAQIYTITAVVTDISCAGADDGAINITVTPALVGATFNWSAPGYTAFTEDIADLMPGTYDLEIITSAFCTIDTFFTVTEPDPIVVVPTVTNSACGQSIGEVMFDITGGTVAGGYIIEVYTIPLLTPVNTTGLDGGSYGYTISDDNGCEVMGTFVISDEFGELTAVVTGTTCVGADNGAIDITISGLTGVLDIQWTFNLVDFSTDEDISMLEPGFYTVTITDENGCVLGDTYEVEDAVGIGITAIIDHIACNGDGDGAIDISYTGEQGSVDFEWFFMGIPFEFTEDISGLDGGTYTIVITDATGCQGTEDFIVNEPDVLDVAANITPVLCNGDNTGAIDITITGGTGAFTPTWTWDGGTSNFQDLSGLEAGPYQLDLIDFNGCAFSMEYIVTEATAIAIDTLQLVNANCDQMDGLLEVEASGGNSPYTYTWCNSVGQNIGSESLIEDLVSGTYTVKVEDEDMCSVSFDITISNSDATLEADITEPTCFGFDDGAIDLTVIGALTDPVIYNWNGPGVVDEATEDLNGITAGDFTVIVSDGAGCMYQETFIVGQPDEIVLDSVIVDVSCNGAMDGSIDISHNLPTEPTYLWNGPGVVNVGTQDLAGLDGGTFELIITTDAGCMRMFSIDVVEPDPLNAEVVITNVTCNNGSDGAIDLTITGGTVTYTGGVGSYDVVWDGPNPFVSTQQDINGLDTGIYVLSILDDNLCQFELAYTISAPDVMSVQVVDQGPSSCNVPIGFIEVEGMGGNGGYTYEWTNSSNAVVSVLALADALPADTYTVVVTDSLGCSSTEDYIISNEDIVLSGIVTNVSCFELCDGAIDLSIVGALVLVDTTWTGPPGFSASSEDISGLCAGDYTVVLEDEFGCTFSDSYTVSEPDEIIVEADFEDLDCFGDQNACISITSIIGGIGDYSTVWEDEVGTPIPGDLEICGLTNGTYTLTVTDVVPCAVEYEYTISSPDPITVDENLLDPTCLGLADGAITINVNGGQGGYDFEWTGGIVSSDEDLVNLGPGTYDLLITDDSLCTHTESYTLEGTQAIDLDLTVDSLDCFGAENGAITALASGVNGGFVYDWTVNGAFLSDEPTINNLAPETYDLVVVDAIGCMVDTSVTLLEPLELIATLESLISVNCNGDENGAIDITLLGGTGSYTIDWVGPDFVSNDVDITDLSGGTYTVTITDENDCELQVPYEVEEPEVLEVSLVSSLDAECQNTADGLIDIAVTGGTPDYGYDWQGPGDPPDTEDLIGILPGQYIVTVTDDHGCVTDGIFVVDYLIEVSVDAGQYDPVCNGNEVILMGTGAPASSDFGWSTPGGPTFSADPIVSVVPTSSNNVFIYTVTNGNCVAVDTTFIDILTLPEPDAGDDQELFIGDEVILGGDPTWPTASSFSWNPSAGLDDPTLANPTLLVSGAQTFTVTVIATNGCLGSDEVTITINPNVDVPDGFTPNGDATNQTWEILNTAQFPEMKVQVYSRWGDRLWESQAGYTEPWDGTYEGKEIPVGTYYYIINLNDERFPDALTGPITIFR